MKIIYIVEDSEIISGILTQVLRSEPNFQVHGFSTGEEMLMHLNEGVLPDIILLDYYLDSSDRGAMNGLNVFAEIQKVKSDLPVILLTGMNDQSKLNDAKEFGFRDVLHKDSDDVLIRIVELVHKHLPA